MIHQSDPLNVPTKRAVVGVNISVTSYSEVVSVCENWVEERRAWIRKGKPAETALAGRYICITSVHGIMTAKGDPNLRRMLNGADIATPDGMPIVWALRSFGQGDQQRVYGPTLMERLCERAAEKHQRLFLYGGTEKTLALLEKRLLARFPGLVIADSYSPPFRPLTESEDAAIKARIRESDADLIFIGISTPKQDRWMWEHRHDFPGSVMIGVGAAFDFHAGVLRQAPSWMQRSGLEWLFRLLMEPKRLWKRYLFITPPFLVYWTLQRAGLLRYDGAGGQVETARP